MGSASTQLCFLILFFANDAGGQQVHRRPPLLHLLIPLHPLLIVYIVVVAVAAPELKWREAEGRGEEGC